jgi:hypothetical protein
MYQMEVTELNEIFVLWVVPVPCIKPFLEKKKKKKLDPVQTLC